MTRNQVAALLWVAGVGAVVVLIVAGALWVRQDVIDGPDDPEPVDARDVVWGGMTTGERVDFCAEARAAGYTVVAAEMTDGGREAQREARYWLEDRCG